MVDFDQTQSAVTEVPIQPKERNDDDLLNFVGALVKEHASLHPPDRSASVSNRKPARRGEAHAAAPVQKNRDER